MPEYKCMHTVVHNLVFTEIEQVRILENMSKLAGHFCDVSIVVEDDQTKMKVQTVDVAYLARSCYVLGTVVKEIMIETKTELKAKHG